MPIVDRPRVVITGAASGLGRAFATEFAKDGASVLIADLDLDGAVETKALVERAGGRAFTIRCDVAKLADVEALGTEAEKTMGGADVVVNNAGVAVAGPIGEVPIKDWEWIVGVNLWGVIYGCHVFAPAFKRQRSGHFINVASLAAIAQAPNMGPYNVTKAGVVSLSETLAGELGEHGAGVTVLCPSFFETNIMNSSRSHGIDAKSSVAKLMKKSPLQAPDIARMTIEDAKKNRLYTVPHREGQVAWALKRLAPGFFHGTLSARASKRIAR